MKVKFYLKGSGRSPVEEFVQELSAELQGEFFDAISLLASGEVLTMTDLRELTHPF